MIVAYTPQGAEAEMSQLSDLLMDAVDSGASVGFLPPLSRAEADAMIYKFFAEHDLPEAAAGKLMVDFRTFRSQLDQEAVESGESDPDGGKG